MARSNDELSRSLEDYLEAIYNIIQKSQIARVKDIAKQLNVKMPSVTNAIRSLASKGLAHYHPYENIELTDAGLELARDIADRHSLIKDFLINVLNLNEEDAEIEACAMEHAVTPSTLAKLLAYVDSRQYPNEITDQRIDLSSSAECVVPKSEHLRLSELCPGSRGKIISVTGRGAIRKRLMDMGITNGAAFEVIRIAPFADPIEIKIRGYNLSLRISEARQIRVKINED